MSTYIISRTVLKPIQFEWFEQDSETRIDCTGLTCAVERTSLPWTPAITVIDAALGKFQIAPPTAPQAASLEAGRRYGVKVVMRDAGGNAVEEFDLVLVAKQ